MFTDPHADALFLFGGDGGLEPAGLFSPLDDLWRFDLRKQQWQVLQPTGSSPPARWHAMTAFDAQERRAYLFGGAGLGEHTFDRKLYAFDVEAMRWEVVRTEGPAPPSVQGGTLTFDSANRVLVMLGGLRHEPPGSAAIADIWIFDVKRQRWDHVEGDDSIRRRDHVAVYDPASRRHYVVGGRISQQIGNFYERGRAVGSSLALEVTER